MNNHTNDDNRAGIFDKYVKESIKDLIVELSKNPLLHFSEKGLQVRLAAKLLNCNELSKPIQTSLYERYEKNIAKLNPDESCLKEALSVTPLQMEYGVYGHSGSRIDIAILAQKEINSINDWQFQKDKNYLNPIIGIEISTEKSGWKNMPAHLKTDADKLENCEIGYILSVMRNTNVRTNQNKIDQIESFKESMRSASSDNTNINYIGLIIHIAEQKVDFFDDKKKWETFEIQSENEKFIDAVTDKLK